MNYLNYFISVLSDTTSDYPSLPSGEDFLAKIIPNIWAFLIQFLSLIVLVIIFFVFAYKPVRKIVKKRQDAIDNEIKSAFDNNNKSKQDLQIAKQTLSDARKNADEIIENAKLEANKQKNEIIKQANEEVRQIKINADEDIKKKYESLKDDIHNEIVDVALLASKQLLKRNVDDKDNREYVKEFIKEVDLEKHD